MTNSRRKGALFLLPEGDFHLILGEYLCAYEVKASMPCDRLKMLNKSTLLALVDALLILLCLKGNVKRQSKERAKELAKIK